MCVCVAAPFSPDRDHLRYSVSAPLSLSLLSLRADTRKLPLPPIIAFPPLSALSLLRRRRLSISSGEILDVTVFAYAPGTCQSPIPALYHRSGGEKDVEERGGDGRRRTRNPSHDGRL